ncbi:TPA: hypothetical protein O4G03_001891 [Proteus mirabilis]|uniref:hypothetical protein n=1 Tax=Proteus mirabilis TaxID=584 RepID=UPI000538E6FC|nr:hypothetical protein [Proteus mirabilis]AUU14587.1 hypothetical protein MC53_011425 [Proteus mirabilis]EKT8509358.1 hypothetical protein [Proteus mirabilis]ELA7788306.1 hypothetical protein [Proteus mirabilis]MBG3137217.1 hypothetical protein [Proteus mirabilis]MBI6220222.1 hypothetical protein [Proteus mirabilis]
MHNVTLSFKYSHHISQYIYGFLLLSKNNIIKLSNIDKDTNITGAQHILRANIDGKKIIYDANDGDHIDRGFFLFLIMNGVTYILKEVIPIN